MTNVTNHPAHDTAMSVSKLVGTNISTLRKNTQTLLRSLVVAIAVENFDQKSTLDASKAAMGYAKLEKKEQGLIRQQFSNVRTVIENYKLFTDVQRMALASGVIPADATDAKAFPDFDAPASPQVNQLAAHCKARDKAAELAAAAPEVSTEVAEELPETTDDAPTSDDTAHIFATIETIDSENPSDDQIAALALLFDAVDAYRQRVILAANVG